MHSFAKSFSHPAVSNLRLSEGQKYDEAYFKKEYWKEDLPGLSGNRGLSYDDPGHKERFTFLFQTLIKPLQPKRLIDIGAGPGFLLEEALARSIDAHGVDLSPVAKNLFCARTDGLWKDRFTVCPLTEIPFSDKAFELCICLDVLEHLIVFDIFSAVQEICRISAADIICSINLDNPYNFHPTILSRDSWIAVFESTGLTQYQRHASDQLNVTVQARYSEYEFFVFHRVAGIR